MGEGGVRVKNKVIPLTIILSHVGGEESNEETNENVSGA
jgi:hypothetical protein